MLSLIRNSARVSTTTRSSCRSSNVARISTASSSLTSSIMISRAHPPTRTVAAATLRRPLSATTNSTATSSSNSNNYDDGSTITTTTTPPISSRYAVVDHSLAYEECMRGPHGKQLQLAQLEGAGKDDPPFNPFWEDELEEERLRQQDGGEDDSDDDDEESAVAAKLYNNDGSVRWKKSQLAAFRAGAPAGGLFAILDIAGSQHKVTTDDLLVVNLLQPVDHYKVGSVHTLSSNHVMMVGSSHVTCVGMPYVTDAQVDVMVEEITQDEKVIVFKKRRRKNSKRKNGHRRDVTFLRILDVRLPPSLAADDHHNKYVPREIPGTAKP